MTRNLDRRRIHLKHFPDAVTRTHARPLGPLANDGNRRGKKKKVRKYPQGAQVVPGVCDQHYCRKFTRHSMRANYTPFQRRTGAAMRGINLTTDWCLYFAHT